jgi:hypothetical protein
MAGRQLLGDGGKRASIETHPVAETNSRSLAPASSGSFLVAGFG